MQRIRSLIQQPLTPVLGLLAAAGMSKGGHGDWVAGAILTVFLIRCSAALTALATRRLAGWVARMQRYDQPPRGECFRQARGAC